MLLVLCVDLDDDLGRKTGFSTPVIGRDPVEEAAVALATADPEDSDVNVVFQGLHVYDDVVERDENVEVAVVTGNDGGDVSANREVGDEVDTVLASLSTSEDVTALVVTDGAQDESVVPVIRSRVPIDGVRRVVVRQAQNLESMYYTIKQVLDDPETRGTVLIPLGILLLIYPLALIGTVLDLPGFVLGTTSALLGLYLISRGLGLGDRLDAAVERARRSLYAGRTTLLAYVVAAALFVLGGVSGMDSLEAARRSVPNEVGAPVMLAALVYGSIHWFAAAGVTSSLGQITDEYIAGSLEWRYLNAPFYVLSIAVVLHAVSAFFLDRAGVTYLAAALTAGTLLGIVSTLTFAVAESRFSDSEHEPRGPERV
jgi:putative membrane protein